MAKFKNPKAQKRYDIAIANHEEYVRGMNGMSNAYRRGYLVENSTWPRSWSSYSMWAAGRDQRRHHQKQGVWPVGK